MITPFIIDDEYTLVFSDKTKQLKTIFYNDEVESDIPEFIKREMNDDLFLYCLKKWWLTIEEPNEIIYTRFKQLMRLTWRWINIESLFRHYDYNKCLDLIDYIDNL